MTTYCPGTLSMMVPRTMPPSVVITTSIGAAVGGSCTKRSAFCAEGIDVCVNDMRLVACADITGGTANIPGSCP
jgi:hypothetical protein